MRYYVVSDTHGFYSIMRSALKKAGYFRDTVPHKLVMLGDIMDRGDEAKEMQDFVLDQMQRDQVILVRGNHEDLLVDLATTDRGLPYTHHKLNGTYGTALQLTDYDMHSASTVPYAFAKAIRETPFYREIIPTTRDYYETPHYVFVHGWIPCVVMGNGDTPDDFSYLPDWRSAGPEQWARARWYNGMDAAQNAAVGGKTIVCGHWHTAYGHEKYEGKKHDFSPYYGPGVIAIDACTAYTHRMNCIVLDD